MKRVVAGARLSTLWLFGPAERPDDRVEPTTAWTAVSFPSASIMYSFEWSAARPMGEQW